GDAAAQYSLGVIYAEGKGVPKHYTKAFEWTQKSANQGHAIAQRNLGVMYAKGEGVKQNIVSAKEWLGKSCDKGYQDGCDDYQKLKE
uniref:tetratricopeptide repeat protein n=1 Tax=Psychrobacter immobilis TaxID=498 RepID=UPI001918CA3A